jgi:hypothetical protein
MGINNCTPATKQIIKAYLQSVGKVKLTDIDYNQADHLRQQIKPKCGKGHVIDFPGSGGPYKCDSGRSGALCLKQMSMMIYCLDKGCGGSTYSNHYLFCLPCGFYGQ